LTTSRTQWHVLFYAAVREHGSRATEALAEVLLSKEPQQGDILLIRRRDVPGEEADAAARTLKSLWRLVPREALIEYKSPSRPPRPGDLAKLIGYGGQVHHLRLREIGAFANLLLVLVVTELSPTLLQEMADLGAPAAPVASGYLLVETRPYRILIVDLSAVVESEGDEWMSVFVPSTVLSADARRWLEEHMPTKDVPANEKLEGHDEVLARLLRSTPPEDILRAAGVDRLLGSLTPEQRLLVTPVEVLRGLSEEYLRTLPEHLQAAIRARLHHRA
jgi:hypothetical protein